MASDLDKLLAYLEVERIDKYLFIGKSPKRPSRIFGGQVLAQALNAASRTVEGARHAHSMHAYFLRPGDPSKQIVFDVDPIRDGRSFTTRRVVAKQDGIAIFNTAISFQQPEDGLSHQSSAPAVTPPDDLESDHDYWIRLAKKDPKRFPKPTINPVERKPVDRRDLLDPDVREPVQHVWVRGCGELGDDIIRHQTLLAYMSDFALLGTALYPHPHSGWSEDIQSASLDHALWFHRPFRADEYLLYSLDSPSAEASRGFSRGSFYTREGVLVASTAQESLIRVRQ
ncbi:MAG: acyl-CoA thioesterase II [Gammaproteobacteria bacterium]|nr:acyl-CoA thioesterase II [Gammaproteobacteria bacterium]